MGAVQGGAGDRARLALRAARRCLCLWLAKHGLALGYRGALWAVAEFAGRLAAVAAAAPADIFIGHNLPALPAAAWAAAHYHAKLGFDAEDSHVDELPDDSANQGLRRLRERIERFYLPRCDHLTAASPLIAKAVRDRYAVAPLSVLNVFPLAEAPLAPVKTAFDEGTGPPSLYWFSQTIGNDRGLEALIVGLANMRTPVHLHLRGRPAQGFRADFERLVNEVGLAGRVHWHQLAAPSEMVTLSAPHDLGLALELPEPPNRGMCLTNKIFTYLLAGIPGLVSRTPAQDLLAKELGPAALLVDLQEPKALATRLDEFFANPAMRANARLAAWRWGRERYNWDCEKDVFLRSVEQALCGDEQSFAVDYLPSRGSSEKQQ